LPDTPLEDLRDRLERERQAADRAYNDALTAVDEALRRKSVAAVEPPPAIDIPAVPAELSTAQMRARRFRGLRAVLWRILGPAAGPSPDLGPALATRVDALAGQQRALHDTVVALAAAHAREAAARQQFEARLIAYFQTITAYVDTRDRRIDPSDLRERLGLAEQRLALLKRELDGRAASEPAASRGDATAVPAAATGRAADAPTYVGFEDRFRGAPAEIRRRVAPYAQLFEGGADVVDVGCGRGELLELLRERGVPARGVDTNAAMVEQCRARGLAVEQGDALGFLQRQADGALGGLAAIQVVEHFRPDYLERFLEAAYLKLRPGSALVLETINPACWMAFFETYLRDLTHEQPLHADTLKFLVEASGFTRVDVQYRSPVTEADRLRRVAAAVPAAQSDDPSAAAILTELVTIVNAHADALNGRLFSSMDYVVIARR
jgi:O-antigen chain-terminating methyltransferase